jgi:hypothetical protein
MPLFLKRRTSPRRAGEVATEKVGHAWVVHAPAGMTDEARALAARLPAEPEHELVVVDLPAGSPSTAWEALAATLPSGKRGIRLFVTGPFREFGSPVGQWLSTRLGRTVTAADGEVMPGAGDVLFVSPAHGQGWLRFRPGEDPEPRGRRFPQLGWEIPLLAESTPIGSGVTAEPLPAGLWLRTDGDERWQTVSRTRLSRLLPCRPDVIMLVLGGQYLPDLPLEMVARFWDKVPADVRPKVRFMQYGPARPVWRAFGQDLADTLGEEVTCYTGIPVGRPDSPSVFTVRPDGSHGWNTYARTFSYRPGASPRLCEHRAPLPDLPEVAPGVYRYEDDAVLEVVHSGLWVRPPREPAHAAAVRGTAMDPVAGRLLYDTSDEEQADRMRAVAESVAARLDFPARLVTRLRPVGTSPDLPPTEPAAAPKPPETAAEELELPWLTRLLGTGSLTPARHRTGGDSRITRLLSGPPAEADEPFVPEGAESVTIRLRRVPVEEPRPDSVSEPEGPVAKPMATTAEPESAVPEPIVREPEPPADAVVVQPPPEPATAAYALDEDRAWLREVWQAEYDAEAAAVEQVLAAHPKLAGHPAGALPDAVAVRWYLAGRDGDIDASSHAGDTGPHARFGRCVAAGLERLPAYRGSTTTTVTLTPAEWEYLRVRPVLAERGFLNLLTRPCASLPGNVDLLVWSSSGRRTAALEPLVGGVADRVVFLPGSRFKVLATVEPGSSARGRILLRELAPTEVDAAGRVENNRSSLDEFAKISLGRAAERWSRKEATERVPPAAARRFHHFPGLVLR